MYLKAQASHETSLEIIEWCKEFLAYFKYMILFMENLPIGTSQKVQKVNIFPTIDQEHLNIVCANIKNN